MHTHTHTSFSTSPRQRLPDWQVHLIRHEFSITVSGLMAMSAYTCRTNTEPCLHRSCLALLHRNTHWLHRRTEFPTPSQLMTFCHTHRHTHIAQGIGHPGISEHLGLLIYAGVGWWGGGDYIWKTLFYLLNNSDMTLHIWCQIKQFLWRRWP